MNEFGGASLARFVLARPALTLAIALALTAGAALPIFRLDITTSKRALMAPEHPSARARAAFDLQFPGSEPLVIVLEAPGVAQVATRSRLTP
ncbi:MAG: hypothetical protein AAFQ82_13070, partial [Myxococcota bacterium]